MRISGKLKAAGIAIGLGLFVATGLFAVVAANKPLPDVSGPVPESVIAPAEQLSNAFAAVANHVKPAVVSVYSEKMVRYHPFGSQSPFEDDFFHQFFGDRFPFHHGHGQPKDFSVPQRGMGSGMILDKQGHILTNYHVVEDVDEIKVQLPDKRTFEAKILGSDRKSDVAVLELQGSVLHDLPTVQLGDSDALQDGNLVMAIGAPFGLTQTVTTGVISATGRSNVGITDYEDFLQTDAPINPGNSGGPLINMHGEVIGMNSAIETSVGQFAGVGFAIPSNMIKTMLPTLLKGKQITRGLLGVAIQNLNKALAEQFNVPDNKGALVAQVSKGSAAEKAGLKVGDVIVKFDGKEVTDTGQLRNLVAATSPGTKVDVVVIRDGKEKTVAATIGTMSSETVASAKSTQKGEHKLARLGLSVQTLTADLASQYGVDENTGVIITGVEDGSLADASGLRAGEVIVEADHKPVTNVDELQSILNKNSNQILLLIKSRNGSIFLVLRLK